MKREDLSVASKKGVSEIISYVLLIVIAIGVGVLVYNLLSALILRPDISCPKDTFIIIKDSSCSKNNDYLNMTLVNKGRFSIHAAYVKVSKINSSIGVRINPDEGNSLYFAEEGLAPNQESTWTFSIIYSPAKEVIDKSANYTLTIQPVIWDKEMKKTAACESITSQVISC